MTGWHPIVRSGAFRAVSAALLFAHVIFSGPVLAEQRIALVVGNSQYGDEIVNLANPANDANLIGAALRRVGFDVKIVLDADQRTFKIAIRDFYERLIAAGPDSTALFYYAGHGLQVSGKNYLVPVQAVISAEADVDLEAIEADVVLRQMGYAGARVMVVILDACRNNPLTRGFRSGVRGLAPMEAPSGSYVAYSTKPGDVAADGTGDNSPYAAALAQAITVRGASIEDTFKNVRVSVASQTGNKQTTWDSSSLTAPFYFVPGEEGGSAQIAATSSSSATTDADFEMTFWNDIKDGNDPAEFEAYLLQFPNGKFAPLAEVKIKKLRGATAQTPPPATTVPAETEVAALETQSRSGEVGPTEPAQIAIEEMDQTFVTRQSANVRAGPGTESPIIGKLEGDQAVSVTGKVVDKGWYRIDHDGEPAYVSAKLLAEADAAEIVAWREASGKGSIEALEEFLRRYPSGYFRDKASKRVASLTEPPPPPPPAASGAATNASTASPPAVIAPGGDVGIGAVYTVKWSILDIGYVGELRIVGQKTANKYDAILLFSFSKGGQVIHAQEAIALEAYETEVVGYGSGPRSPDGTYLEHQKDSFFLKRSSPGVFVGFSQNESGQRGNAIMTLSAGGAAPVAQGVPVTEPQDNNAPASEYSESLVTSAGSSGAATSANSANAKLGRDGEAPPPASGQQSGEEGLSPEQTEAIGNIFLRALGTF